MSYKQDRNNRPLPNLYFNIDAQLAEIGRWTVAEPIKEPKARPEPHCDCKEACEEWIGKPMHVFQGSASDVPYVPVPTLLRVGTTLCHYCGYETTFMTTPTRSIQMRDAPKRTARAKPIKCTNVKTGEVKRFRSITEAELLKLAGANSIPRSIKTQKPVKGWLWEYDVENALGASDQSK
jgi:hypothetical protein